MEFKYIILPEKSLVLERFKGRFDKAAMMETVRTIWENPRYQPHFNGLLDLRQAEVKIEVEDLRELTKLLEINEKAARGKFVLLISDALAAALSMVLSSQMMDTQEIAVHSSLEAAFNTLDADPELFEELESEQTVVVNY